MPGDGLKGLAKSALARLGLRVSRLRPGNRFDAMAEGLALLARAGYRPRLVIDGGANQGQWSGLARPIFPEAHFELIEPQPACAPVLSRLASASKQLSFHPVALTGPGESRVRLLGGGAGGGCTGAFVARAGESSGDEAEVPATSLDELFAARVTPADRAFLKLDIEGHEREALLGGEKLLAAVEVVLLEVQIFEINANGRPVFRDLLAFLDERGFDLYDVLTLSPRPRDQRLRMADVLFVRRGSPLLADRSWE